MMLHKNYSNDSFEITMIIQQNRICTRHILDRAEILINIVRWHILSTNTAFE